MASPKRIYSIYLALATDAETVRAFQEANGEKISGTVNLLLSEDTVKPLQRWGEEMHELCGVLDGSHHDSYLMESTQTFYWASIYAAMRRVAWDDLHFEDNRRKAVTCGISNVVELRASVDRLVALGAAAKPEKCFLMWNVADNLYRLQTDKEDQWSIEQLMEADLQDMKKRSYLAPILRATEE